MAAFLLFICRLDSLLKIGVSAYPLRYVRRVLLIKQLKYLGQRLTGTIELQHSDSRVGICLQLSFSRMTIG